MEMRVREDVAERSGAVKPSMETEQAEPLVVAVIVGRNHRRWLEPCLTTFRCSDYQRMRAVYVDNASSDGSAQLVRLRYPDIEVLEGGGNLGFARASNLGIAWALRAGADHVLLLNPDTRTPPGLVRRLVQFLAAYPAYGIIGPLQRAYGAPRLNAWSRHALENGERHVFHHWDARLPSEAGPPASRAAGALEHSYVQGAALIIRANVLREIGGFDARYHSFYEEVDLCRRARRAGYRVALLLDAFVEHEGGSESAGSRYRNFHMTRNRILYMLTDTAIGPRAAARLLVFWLVDDVFRQLPGDDGTITDARGLAGAWLSVACNLPWAWKTRRRSRRVRATAAAPRCAASP
jgi:GT2 family glycosyltransferase